MSEASDRAAKLKRAIFALAEGMPTGEAMTAFCLCLAHAIQSNYLPQDHATVLKAMNESVREALKAYKQKLDTS